MKSNHLKPTSLKTKKRAWSHIFLQVAFPLATGFGMANAAAAQDLNSHALTADETKEQIQQWQNKVGTVQAPLVQSKESGLKHSQLAKLLPQTGREYHAQSDVAAHRDFSNIALDLSSSQAPMQADSDVASKRDYLKLGGNGYLRSNWKNVSGQQDTQERLANSWNLRAQTWLSEHPQIGGELSYEQFYGRQADLFESNPHAVTMAVHYTPIPLLTFSAAQRQGTSSSNDTIVGVLLHYPADRPDTQL